MGYTHYWERPQEIPQDLFSRIRADFERLILPLSDMGVDLADWDGTGAPTITDDLIRFNGVTDCGHPENEDLVIPYPTQEAQGVGASSTAVAGDFYGCGVTVRHRSCNGHCSYETFTLARKKDLGSGEGPDENGLYGESVKTGFRPYDVAVTAALLIAKRHLCDRFVVQTNGAEAQWSDGKRLCQKVLGYGDWFGIVEEEVEEHVPGQNEPRRFLLRILIGVPEPRFI
ncbi:MAG: hypothetical protein LAO55_17625 [Acidobacteriia bacterium]|nr:hypothetical protein [Terriglobia bacterium]